MRRPSIQSAKRSSFLSLGVCEDQLAGCLLDQGGDDSPNWELQRNSYICKDGIRGVQQRTPLLAIVVVQLLSHVWLFLTPWTAARQASLSFTISQRVCSDSCPLSWWCHPTISSSVIPFSCLQSFLASGSFLRSKFFTSSGQSIRALASASVLPMNIQDWFLLGWTGWISLQYKGLSGVFSNTTIQKHQFFGTHLSL